MVLNENIDSEKYGQIRKIYINLIFAKAGKKEENHSRAEIMKLRRRLQRDQGFSLDEKIY